MINSSASLNYGHGNGILALVDAIQFAGRIELRVTEHNSSHV